MTPYHQYLVVGSQNLHWWLCLVAAGPCASWIWRNQSCMFSHLILKTLLGGGHCPYFTDEESRHREVKCFALGHTMDNTKSGPLPRFVWFWSFSASHMSPDVSVGQGYQNKALETGSLEQMYRLTGSWLEIQNQGVRFSTFQGLWGKKLPQAFLLDL